MCKIKTKCTLLLSLVVAMLLSGCGSSASLLTDTGGGAQKEIPIEDYLNVGVLEQGEQTVESLYNVITLEKGIFTEEALKQILKRNYINVPTVRFDLDGISAQFGEYVAIYMQYVEVGDVIATVYTDVDEIALNEAQKELQRLEERYRDAEAQIQEEMQNIADERAITYNPDKQKILDIRYRQKQLDWDNTKYNYDSQITTAKENLAELTKVGKIYEIKSTIEGYVNFDRRYNPGDEVKDGDYVCHVMSGTEVYTTTRDQSDRYHYGMQVTFDNKNGAAPGTVINGGNWAMYGNLDSDKVIFRLDFDRPVEELDNAGLNNLVLKGNLKTMENVVLVPKKAVTQDDNGNYYVTVLQDDGTLLKTEFIPGGSNLENYWVLEGLTEGMRIVYK